MLIDDVGAAAKERDKLILEKNHGSTHFNAKAKRGLFYPTSIPSNESGNGYQQGDDETTDANESALAELIMPGGSKKRTYLELEEVYV